MRCAPIGRFAGGNNMCEFPRNVRLSRVICDMCFLEYINPVLMFKGSPIIGPFFLSKGFLSRSGVREVPKVNAFGPKAYSKGFFKGHFEFLCLSFKLLGYIDILD